MEMKNEKIVKDLFAMQDLKYRTFQTKLMPTINPDAVIGVRTPELRSYAKKMNNDTEIEMFLKTLPHQYYEENNLHAFLIEQIKDFDQCIAELNRFLPYVDNWATCDMMRPKCLKKNQAGLLTVIEEWMKSDYVYMVRYAIEILMLLYLDDNFKDDYLDKVAAVKNEEYYIKMMVAWYFATALAKQYESAIKVLEEKRLESWTHNKAIQKALESNRISSEKKSYLRTLKVVDYHVT